MTYSSLQRRPGGSGEGPKLPPYPHYFAAPSIGSQLETRAESWRNSMLALEAEVEAAVLAVSARLDAQDAGDAARDRLRNLAGGRS